MTPDGGSSVKVPAEAGQDIRRIVGHLEPAVFRLEGLDARYVRLACIELLALEARLRHIATTELPVHNCDAQAIEMRQQARIALGGDWTLKVKTTKDG